MDKRVVAASRSRRPCFSRSQRLMPKAETKRTERGGAPTRLLALLARAALERARRDAVGRERRCDDALADTVPGNPVRLPQARVERLGDVGAIPHHAVLFTVDVAGDVVVEDLDRVRVGKLVVQHVDAAVELAVRESEPARAEAGNRHVAADVTAL